MTLLAEDGTPLLAEDGTDLYAEDYIPATGWEPGDPWPGTAGGANRDGWSPYIRLYLTAAIGAGQPWTVGPDTAATLDAGNVISFPGQTATSTLDVDLTAPLTALHIQGGATAGAGIFSKPDAAVLEAELYDPDAKYDPLNPYSVYGLNSSQRLTPGVPISCWAEIVDPADATITTISLFTGTADRWSEAWTKEPNDRRAILQATDPTKLFAKATHPALTVPVGSGEHVNERIARIVAEYGWTGTVTGPTTGNTSGNVIYGLTATDMGSSGWDQFTALMELEIGFLHFSRTGELRWLNRTAWTHTAFARIFLGDPDDNPAAHDIVTDAVPLSLDRHLHNSIYAARTGGTVHHYQADNSVEAWTEQPLTRTDLELQNDNDVTAWALTALSLEAYPQTTLESVTVQPAVAAEPWTAYVGVLGAGLITAIIRTFWHPPHQPHATPIDSRIVGWECDITPIDWAMRLELVSANMSQTAPTFTIGPGPRDTLDAGNIIAF